MKNLKKKSIISLILILIMIFNVVPFGAFTSVVNAISPGYSATIEDVNFPTRKPGYNTNSDTELVIQPVITNTGTKNINIGGAFSRIILTGTNADDFQYGWNTGGGTAYPGDNIDRGYIKPKNGLGTGTYQATINYQYKEADEWETLATSTVTFKVTEHNFSSEWNSNSSTHWHPCLDTSCTEKGDEAPHNSNDIRNAVSATFENDGFSGDKHCSVCGYKVENGKDIPAGKYILDSRATITPNILTAGTTKSDYTITSTEPTKYTITPSSWWDVTTSEELDASTKLIAGHKYRVLFMFNAVSPYEYGKADYNSSKFYLNDNLTGTTLMIDSSPYRYYEFVCGTSGTQHQVTFNLDGGTMAGTNPVTVNNGEKLTKPTTDPIKSGYEFWGWYKDATLTTEFDFATEIITTATTIYAKWLAKAVGMELKTDGGQLTTEGYKLNVDSLNVTFHTDATPVTLDVKDVSTLCLYNPDEVSTNTALMGLPVEKTPYYFIVNLQAGDDYNPKIYWDDAMKTASVGTATDGKIEYVTIGHSPNSGGVSIIFKYTKHQFVPVTYMDGDTILLSSGAWFGEKVERPSEDPEKTGFRFAGWYKNKELTTLFDFDTEIASTAIKIYANFIEQVNITVDYNGGTNNGFISMPLDKGSVLNKADVELSLNSPLITPPTNKAFDYLEINNVKWTEDTYTLDNNITIKIIWKDKTSSTQWTITFINGTNSTTIGTDKVYDGQKITRPATDPTMLKHRFDNWYSDVTMTTPFNFDTLIETHTVVYAKFIEQFVVTTNLDGGTFNMIVEFSGQDKGTVLYRDSFETIFKDSTKVTPPTKKEFDYIEIDGTKWTEDTYVLNSDITIKVIWKDKAPKEYMITYDLNGGTADLVLTPFPIYEGFESLIPTWEEIKGYIHAPANKVYDGVEINGTRVDIGINFVLTEDITIKLLWKDLTSTYTILEGDNQTYILDSNIDVIIKASGDLAKLAGIKVDSTTLDSTKQKTESGSTVLTLFSSYLNTLAEGDHTVELVYNDGSASAKLTVAKASTSGGNTGGSGENTNTTGSGTSSTAPKTGDNITLWIVLFLVSTLGIAGTVKHLRKRD